MNFTGAKNMLLCQLGCAALVCFVPFIRAAVYDFSLGDAGNRSLRLNIPDSVPVVRGIIIYGNGANLDARDAATDPELVALATSLECAVMGTAYWGYFSTIDTPMELPAFKFGLQQLGRESGHPEIFNAPWLPSGMSNGGNMAYELNAQRPAKVIAFMTNKGGYYSHLRPAVEALATPGVLIAGERDDGGHHAVIQDLFTGNRLRGALWVAMEEEGVAHNTGNAREFFYPYLEAMFRARYPVGASPVAGLVPLGALNPAEGWLTDPDSYRAGFADIAPYAVYPKDRSRAGWLPNRRLAYIFRAFASYHKATPTATIGPGTGPVDWGTSVTYTIGQPVAPWTSVEFYEGDVLLKRVRPVDGDNLAVTTTPTAPGYSVYHALVTFADGSRHTTMPRRVFVRAGPPQVPAIVLAPDGVTAQSGDSVTFSASAAGNPVPACQWRKNGVNLVNAGNISGATNTTLAITNVQAGDAGSYTFVATNAVGRATSAAIQLAVRPAAPAVASPGAP
ncbi:MAG TPA: immunoglobulin domain-containing protein [Opitutaceae bacterium]|nr:immunoglobulin domain-containing protein [Opitutaceae bacterium]